MTEAPKRLREEELSRFINKAGKGQHLYKWQVEAIFEHILALEAEITELRAELARPWLARIGNRERRRKLVVSDD